MKKFKSGDSVLVPIGTPTSFFCGSLLDKNPFKKGKMEYNLIGKIVTIDSKNASVEPWYDRGNGACGLLNFHPRYLQKTRFILKWDYDKQTQRVIDPKSPTPNNFKEYFITVEQTTGQESMFQSWEWPAWAKNRKHAVNLGKKFAKEKGLENPKISAKLYWKGNYLNR